MKRIAKLGAAVALAMTAVACTNVPPGFVGVKVHKTGSKKGVDVEQLGVGWHSVWINEDVFKYPTYTQNHTWEGTKRQFTFQSSDGLSIAADIGLMYHIEADKAPEIFQRYRRGIDEITDIVIRNVVRDSLVREAAMIKADMMYGESRTDLIERTQARAQKEFEGTGIVVERVFWIGNLVFPQSVIDNVNRKVNATQMTALRENEVAQVVAEAEKVRAEAKGRADAITSMANAEAESIRVRGEALRLYPEVIELNRIEKWDGVLPRVTSDATPLINIGDLK